MKIAFFHPACLPIAGYGGTERILFWHMVELVKQGHQVTYIGHPESKLSQYGIDVLPYNTDVSSWPKLLPAGTDIVHFPFNVDFTAAPAIYTVHGNGQVGEKLHLNSVFVSKKHAEIHGSDQFVHNALDFSEYPFLPKKNRDWNSFLFLAKASWKVKNLAHAVKACRANAKHLDVAGGRWLGLSRYIHNQGVVGGEKKLELIRKSDALLFPVRWHEPFGIAVIEAMSQGVPVIGSPYGSLPELITKDSGFIAHNFQELSEYIKVDHAKTFNPEVVRMYAEKNFGITQYTESYVTLYKKIIGGASLNPTPPTYQFSKRAEDLLPF